ncbi:MAG: kinase [Actinophytocola sp.]|uniref:serine protein kinase RIO n=1 Tax=Actinophytocola sp. TaxID=1872138 RepID=UPI00132B1422|nr:RIO1 family regulatory kinase/ATPase [Actinophytocola sp.]MPZ85115.1 kinase [Actinophytocola sp.]
MHDTDDHFDDYLDDNPFGGRRSRPRKPKQSEAARSFEGDFDQESTRAGRLTEAERARLAAVRESALAGPVLPPGADRWTTWDDGEQGPHPRPDWLVTELAAADTELGVLKSGKEADVHLIRRAVPDTDRGCVMAAKRYRSNEHRMFHRDSGYLEGRRMRRSREMRAIANRTSFGRNLIAEQWAVAEFAALSRLWSIGVPVPYPVQRSGTELLMEFLGSSDGEAAPRLAELRPDADELVELWHQLVAALELLAGEGMTHGDLSAYNVLVHKGQVMLIDLPQIVDVVANPRGREFLARDVSNVMNWFRARGLPDRLADPDTVTGELLAAAGLD